MIFLNYWWTLLVLYGFSFALETKEAKQQLKERSNTKDFSQMPVKKFKLESKKCWSWLRNVDDWCIEDTKSVNQPEEFSGKKKEEEAIDQDNTLSKNDPKNNYKLYKMELSDRFHKVLSGRVPKEITNIVFELIHNDMGFEKVLSVLERNLKARKEKLRLLEKEEGDSCEILTKLKCCRDRNPLVPRLQEFFDMILKTADEEQKIREKRLNSLWFLAENYTNKISQHQDLTVGNKFAEIEVIDEL